MKNLKAALPLLLISLIVACHVPISRNSTPTNIDVVSVTPSNNSVTPSPFSTKVDSTPTSLPAISTDTSKEVLEDFVQGNGGCKLPCIMGLAPRLSENPEVNAFIEYFQQNAREAENLTDDVNIWSYLESSQGGISLRFFEENKSVSIGLGFIIDGDKVSQILLGGESLQHFDGGTKTQFGDPYFNSLLHEFTLSNVLNIYGLPSQILIWPFPDSPGHPSPPAQYMFSFVLLYNEKGFLAQYTSERKERDNYFVGCPTEPHSLDISAWDPKVPLDLIDAVKYFSNVDGINSQNASVFKALEDVTSLNIREFYEVFRATDTTECIETLKDLWP